MTRFIAALLLASTAVALAAETPAKKPAAPSKGPKWQLVKPQPTPGVKEFEKLTVAQYGDRKVTADVCMPEAPAPGRKYPGILFIHGGGWSKGDIQQDKPIGQKLAAQGFVCVLVDYRLSGEAKYPAALNDCKAAIRWMRANASTYKIDPAHIGVIGGSAGGHLSGLLAMTNEDKSLDGDGGNADQSSAVQACIVMACTMDMAELNKPTQNPSALAFFGDSLEAKPELYRSVSPLHRVTSKAPPTIFIEGEKDTEKKGRPEMMEKLKSFGIETAVHTLKDAPHPFWMSEPWQTQAYQIALDFFTRQLKK